MHATSPTAFMNKTGHATSPTAFMNKTGEGMGCLILLSD